MNTATLSLLPDYLRFKETSGYSIPPGRAACALNSAKTLAHWRIQEKSGRVRLRAEHEQENYFDVYGEPDTESERKAIVEQIERLGCWFIIAEYRCSHCGEWKHAASVGMCIYDNPLDPFQNDYVIGLMAETLDALN